MIFGRLFIMAGVAVAAMNFSGTTNVAHAASCGAAWAEPGTYKITGNFRVVNAAGKIIENKEPIFLCRCGGSSNKPYCDGTHNRNGFSI